MISLVIAAVACWALYTAMYKTAVINFVLIAPPVIITALFYAAYSLSARLSVKKVLKEL